MTLFVDLHAKANKKLYIGVLKIPFSKKTTLPKVFDNQIFYN